MRSSNKQRSRNKGSSRNRNVGNIVNRVFDSAGPEGKVRGTPQQIIEKYQTLARDAQLSGDRIAAENFQQHAEHYTRMLDEAQREIAERQQADQQRQQQHGGQQQRGDDSDGQDNRDRGRESGRDGRQRQNGADVMEVASDGEDGPELVDTPESQAKTDSEPPRKARRPRSRSKAKADTGEETPSEPEVGAPAE